MAFRFGCGYLAVLVAGLGFSVLDLGSFVGFGFGGCCAVWIVFDLM